MCPLKAILRYVRARTETSDNHARRRELECGTLRPMVQLAKSFGVFKRFGGALAFSCIISGAAACASNPPAPASSTNDTGAAEPAPVPATVGESQAPAGVSVFVVHLMSDFDAFKKYFEQGEPARAQAGIKGHLLTRLDDGRVIVHLFADDVVKVQDALKSPEMERYLDRKGSPESSLLWLTENEFVKIPATAPDGPTFSLYLKLKVADFAALEQGFKADLPLFAEHAVIGEGLHKSFDRDIAILHFMGTSREKLEALVKRPEFGELLAHAGSQGEVKPLIGPDVSRSRPENLVSSK
jgi:hypothetical protein